MAGVVTEDEKRWELCSKENLLPRISQRVSAVSHLALLSAEYSFLNAAGEQLSSSILVAATSDIIDAFQLILL